MIMLNSGRTRILSWALGLRDVCAVARVPRRAHTSTSGMWSLRCDRPGAGGLWFSNRAGSNGRGFLPAGWREPDRGRMAAVRSRRAVPRRVQPGLTSRLSGRHSGKPLQPPQWRWSRGTAMSGLHAVSPRQVHRGEPGRGTQRPGPCACQRPVPCRSGRHTFRWSTASRASATRNCSEILLTVRDRLSPTHVLSSLRLLSLRRYVPVATFSCVA